MPKMLRSSEIASVRLWDGAHHSGDASSVASQSPMSKPQRQLPAAQFIFKNTANRDVGAEQSSRKCGLTNGNENNFSTSPSLAVNQFGLFLFEWFGKLIFSEPSWGPLVGFLSTNKDEHRDSQITPRPQPSRPRSSIRPGSIIQTVVD